MKILFIVNSLRNYGGLEKWHIQIGNALTERGHDVVVQGIDLGEYKRVELGDIDNFVKFKYTEEFLESPRGDILYTSIGNRKVLENILKLSGPKIFGAHHGEYIRFSNATGITWSSEFFSVKSMKYKLWFNQTLKLLPKFDAVHYLNHGLDWLARINGNIFYLPNTNLMQISNLAKPKDKFGVLFFGRHETEKGVDTVIKVANALPQDVNLTILGTGSRSKELSNIERPNVHFLGQVSDSELTDRVATSQLILMPSYSENSSIALRESLSNGTPLVARDFEDLAVPSLCHIAKSDDEFLEYILENKNQFYSDPDSYIIQCQLLKSKVLTKSEYVDRFEKLLLFVSQNFQRREKVQSNK